MSKLIKVNDSVIRKTMINQTSYLKKIMSVIDGKYVAKAPASFIKTAKNGAMYAEKRGIMTCKGLECGLNTFLAKPKNGKISNTAITTMFYKGEDGKTHKSARTFLTCGRQDGSLEAFELVK